MPRFFDDYSNTYLTHDSSAGRKQQRRGWKFRENFRLHYQKYVQDWRRGQMGLASAQQAYIRARGKDDNAIPPLPDGWKEYIDDVTGISYYVNTSTGKRVWVRPGFIPPPPGQQQQQQHHGQSQRHGPPPTMMGGPPMLGRPPSTTTTGPGMPPPPMPLNMVAQQQQQQFRGPPPPLPTVVPPPPQPPNFYGNNNNNNVPMPFPPNQQLPPPPLPPSRQ